MSRPFEIAMTHRIGAGGVTERCDRPKAIREIADRVRRWASTSETCQSCSCLPAVRVRAGMALCGRCHAERQIRIGLDPVGRPVRAETSEDDTTGVVFRGTAVVFNSASVNLGGFIEYIRPAAADRTFAENIDTRALWSHNADFTIGRTSAGTLRSRKTTRGIAVEIDPPRWAQGYVETVRRRDVQGMSFGFETLDDGWHLEEGEPVREIFDMRVFEYSSVAFPAYEATTLRVERANDRSEWLREQVTAERLRMAR